MIKKLLYFILGTSVALGITAYAALPVTQTINGGTGSGVKPTLGQILLGNSDGTYSPQATSTLGFITSSSLVSYAKLDASNQPFTGNLGIGAVNIGGYTGSGLTINSTGVPYFEQIINASSSDSLVGVFRSGNTSNSTLAGIAFKSGTTKAKGKIIFQTSAGSTVLDALTIGEDQSIMGTSTAAFNDYVVSGGDNTHAGAIEIKPANPAYNWYTLVNKETGSNEGFAFQRGAYPTNVQTTMAVSQAGAITTPKGSVSFMGLNYSVFTPLGCSGTLASSTNYYFGARFNSCITTSAGINRVYIQKTGTIKSMQYSFQTGSIAASAETATLNIRLNNTTDTSVVTGLNFASNNTITQSLVTGLSIAVTAGDYVEFKLTTPAWSVLPSLPMFNTSFYVE